MKRRKEVYNNKTAQITLFVILALAIVAILIFMFYPTLKRFVAPSINDFMPNFCIEEAIKPVLNLTMARGGNLNPELFFRYNNETISYLCYTSEWYKTCVMQEPLLKQEIESQVETATSKSIKNCIADMKRRFESKGWKVETSGAESSNIEIIPGKVLVSLDLSLELEKGEDKQTISSSRLKTEFKSSAYELIMIASAIQNWEARYGDSTPETFMSFYPSTRIEKLKQDDGTKIYTLSDRETGEALRFATRSLAWPPGYALPVEFGST